MSKHKWVLAIRRDRQQKCRIWTRREMLIVLNGIKSEQRSYVDFEQIHSDIIFHTARMSSVHPRSIDSMPLSVWFDSAIPIHAHCAMYWCSICKCSVIAKIAKPELIPFQGRYRRTVISMNYYLFIRNVLVVRLNRQRCWCTAATNAPKSSATHNHRILISVLCSALPPPQTCIKHQRHRKCYNTMSLFRTTSS